MIRDFVKYKGIPDKISSSKYFRQIVVNQNFCLPIEKPDIEQITSVAVSTEEVYSERIQTPVGTSEEGYHLSGSSVAVRGNLNIKMKYVGLLPKQPIFSAYFVLPFFTTVVLEECANIESGKVEVYVEDIDIKATGPRCIFVRSALYVTVKNYDRGDDC